MDNNRRHYFRIYSNINYEMIEISSEQANMHGLQSLAHPDYILLKELSRLQSENISLLSAIEDKVREVSAYLQTLDQRLETLSHLVISRQMNFSQQANATDLSAGGLKINLDKEIELGTYAFFHLLLSPSMIYVPAITKVIKVMEKDQGFETVFEFEYIDESDRDRIAKHVLKLQAEQRRNAND